MHHEIERARAFGRRALLLGGAQAAVFAALATRLHYLQVERSEEFALLAEDNRADQRLLAPPRGRILDRLGRPLARNVPTYRVLVVREQAHDLRGVLERVAGVVELPAERIDSILAEARVRRAFVPLLVREDLSWDEVARLAVRSPELPGVALDSGLLRDYPEGPALAHVLGYVGAVNVGEQAEDPDPLLHLPEFRIGKSGIERSYDRVLRGRAGLSRVEVNALGREIRELGRQEGVAGEDVRLSLDLELQRFAIERLSAQPAASAVVLDARTGGVMALASVPSFDPRLFSGRLRRGTWQELSTDPRTPLVNKCIRGQYPPGSTFKIVTAMAALEHGISPDHTVFCSGSTSLGRAVFHCWKEHGHGTIALTQALAQSCDVYFYDVARRVGVDVLAAMATRFGFGTTLGIDLPGEQPGPDPDDGLETGHARRELAEGRDARLRHRPGLRLRHPPAARGHGRARGQWRPRRDTLAGAAHRRAPRRRNRSGCRQPRWRWSWAACARWSTVPAAPPGRPISACRGWSWQARRAPRRSAGSRAPIARRPPQADRHPLDRAPPRPVRLCGAVADPRYAVAVVVEHGQSGAAAAAPIARDIMRRALELDPAGHGPMLAGSAGTPA